MNIIFVNKDAEYLWELAESFERDDLPTMMRLRNVAQNLESLSSKAAAADQSTDYGRGVLDGMRRVYERSNLPPNERSMPPQAASQLGVPVTRVPTGKSGAAVPKQPKARKLRVAGLSQRTLDRLVNIKIDLAALRLSKEE